MQKQNNLSRQISGALKITINAHGPITSQYVSSATKRICGNLQRFNKIDLKDDVIKERLLVLASKYYEHLLVLRQTFQKKNITREEKIVISTKSKQIKKMLQDIQNLLGATRLF